MVSKDGLIGVEGGQKIRGVFFGEEREKPLDVFFLCNLFLVLTRVESWRVVN